MDDAPPLPALRPSAECLTDDDAAVLVTGDLDAELRERLNVHLDGCERCRRLVSALVAVEISTQDTVPDTDAEPTGLRAGHLLGRFRLIRLLGHGSMGEVWAARDPELDREVALKLLRVRPGALDGQATARMRREAQAMARLNHGNVVTIHELGTDDRGRVFCAMELVDGVTLRGWLTTPRSWRAVMAVASAVGNAMIAAHAAGLIHRDIKPENVLIAADGRTLVSDFGLAKLADLGAAEDLPDPPADGAAAAALTATGAVIGTPLYMAPEQLAGRSADARSDQFSYCVTIYEALFGDRPFDGASLEGLQAAIARGPARPRELRGVPRGVLRGLARGLAADPAARWPAMAALVTELERAARRPRRQRLAGAAVVIVGAVITTRALVGSQIDSCASGAELIEELWSPAVRDAQIARFTRLDPGASVSITSASRLVDDWTAAWKLGRRAACTVDEPRRAVRLDCLDRDLHDLRAQLALWQAADRTVLDTVVRAASELPDLSGCVAPPPGSALNPILAGQIAQSDALIHSGRAALVRGLIAPMLAIATATGNPRDLAVALVSAGRAERDADQLVQARDHLAQAAREAGRAGDDATLLDALIDEAGVIIDLGQPLVSLGLLDAAQAIDARTGLRATSRVMVTRGGALQQAGRVEEAIATLRAIQPAVEADAARDARSRLRLGALLTTLAAALRRTEDYQGAFTLVSQALAIHEASLGPSHPDVARSLGDLALCEMHLERFADARAHLARARAIALGGSGARDALLGDLDIVSAEVAQQEDRPDDARSDFDHARATLGRVLAPDHPRFAVVEAGLGELERARDRCKVAIPHFERALHILEVSGHDPRDHANHLVDLGFCLTDVGRIDEGRNVLTRAVSELADLHMNKRWFSEPHAALADLEYAAGHRAAAIELERKALAELADDHNRDATPLREYEQQQLARWTK